MAKYAYPAVFTKENNGYSIIFRDLEGCYTCSDTLAEGLEMAEDALSFTLYDYEQEGREIPPASDIQDVEYGANEFVTYVLGDTDYYKRKHNNKAIKKTLTIPEWMNEEAMAQGINFSQLLQEAIEEKLGV